MLRPSDVLPTPGGPTKHRIGPRSFPTSDSTAMWSRILSLTSSKPWCSASRTAAACPTSRLSAVSRSQGSPRIHSKYVRITEASGVTDPSFRSRSNSWCTRSLAWAGRGVPAMTRSISAHSESSPSSPAMAQAPRASSCSSSVEGRRFRPPAPRRISSSILAWMRRISFSRTRISRRAAKRVRESSASSSSCFSAVPTSRWPAIRCASRTRSPISCNLPATCPGTCSDRRAYSRNSADTSATRSSSSGSGVGSGSYSQSDKRLTRARRPFVSASKPSARARPSPSMTTRAVPSAKRDTCITRITVPARCRPSSSGSSVAGSF